MTYPQQQNPDAGLPPRSISNVPVPDPSTLTTSQLKEAIENLKNLLEAQISATKKELDDFQKRYDEKHQSDINSAVDHRKELSDAELAILRTQVDAQFEAIQRQLKTIDEGVQARYEATDLRYQQRYDAQSEALEAAFEAQQKATAAALAAAKEAVQCVSADTPVLCADLIWRPAGDLLPGDELVAFDEFSSPQAGVGRQSRRFRKATVTGNALKRDVLLRVNTTKGSVRCNYEHPWLVRRGRKTGWKWVKATDLLPNDEVMHPFDVWEVDRSWEAGWLSGMFDGEGFLTFKTSYSGKPKLGLVQTVGLTADNIDQALKSRIPTYAARLRSAKESPPRKAKYDFEINERASIVKLLGSVRPARLLVNSDQVWEGRDFASQRQHTTITSIDSGGTGVIASLSTSTKTYIAGGFAMHNTAQMSSQKAIDKAETATEKLFPRAEAESRFADISQQLERRFIESEKAVSNTLASSEKAISKAEEANEKRFVVLTDSLKLLETLTGTTKALAEAIDGLEKVTDAKFVTFRTLIDSQADKVAIALAAADKSNANALAAVDKSNAAALAASERAVTKAEIANEKRFEAVDEFRQLWADQTKSFLTRNEFASTLAATTDRINQIASQAGDSMSRAEVESRFTFVSKQVDDLRLFTAGLTGKSQGTSNLWGIILGAVGLIGGLIGIFFALSG